MKNTTFYDEITDPRFPKSPYIYAELVLENVFGKALHANVLSLANEIVVIPFHPEEGAFAYTEQDQALRLNAIVCIYKFLKSNAQVK